MPLVRLTLSTRYEPERRTRIADGVHQAIVDALGLQPGNRFQVVYAVAPEDVRFDPDFMTGGRQDVVCVEITLVRGDATSLPCPDNAFDAATVAYGIRNVVDTLGACRELHRVLRPGGRLVILEFGQPRIPGVKTAYRWYFQHLLPRVGRAISKYGDAYSYLPASVEKFPAGAAFAAVLRDAGFVSVQHVSMTLGISYMYVVEKPHRSAPAPYTGE